MMMGALVERRSPGRRVTHESMCWVGAAQESNLVQHPRIARCHRKPLLLPVHGHLACSLQESLLVQEARKPGRRSMGRVGTVQESNLIEPPRVAGGPGRVAWLGAALDLMLLEGAAPRRWIASSALMVPLTTSLRFTGGPLRPQITQGRRVRSPSQGGGGADDDGRAGQAPITRSAGHL